MKTPGGWNDPNRRALKKSGLGVPEALEHAEHDGADKGECDIRGDNAQSADERTDEGHWELSLLTSLTSLPANAEISKPFRTEKVRAAVSP